MRRELIVTLLLAALLLGGCGDAGVDPVTGTGSAGGNPLTVDFETEDSPSLVDVTWQTPVLHLGSMRLALTDEDSGDCVFGAEAESLDREIAFERGSSLDFEAPAPCAIQWIPAPDQPLISVSAQIGGEALEIDLGAGALLTARLEGLDRLALSEEAVAVFEVDKLLDGVDVQGLVDALTGLLGLGEVELDALIERATANLDGAITLYLDPTPGDGVLLPEERVEANVLAVFALEAP